MPACPSTRPSMHFSVSCGQAVGAKARLAARSRAPDVPVSWAMSVPRLAKSDGLRKQQVNPL